MLRTTIALALLAPVSFAAHAATNSFEARLAAPAAEARLISSELIWNCAGTACAARGAMVDAPSRLCSRLARDAGELRAFAVNGVGFDVARLETCNAKARARSAGRREAERERVAVADPRE